MLKNIIVKSNDLEIKGKTSTIKILKNLSIAIFFKIILQQIGFPSFILNKKVCFLVLILIFIFLQMNFNNNIFIDKK